MYGKPKHHKLFAIYILPSLGSSLVFVWTGSGEDGLSCYGLLNFLLLAAVDRTGPMPESETVQ